MIATMHTEGQETIQNKAYKSMMYLAIIAISMAFAGLTSAYIVRSADPGWLHFSLPNYFYVSTGVILLSSLTMYYALTSAKKDNYTGISIGIILTFILGIIFAICQFKAWNSLIAQGIFLTGKGSNPAGSFLYVLSGMHLLHLFGGLIMLLFILVKSLNKKYNSNNILGLQLGAIYWHYLDLLWVYLLLFLIFAH